MKQVTINVYQFNELNEEAKKRAINDARGWVVEGQTDILADMYGETIEKVEELLGIKVKMTNKKCNWSWTKEAWDRWSLLDDDGIANWLKPELLCRFLNEIDGKVCRAKRYWTGTGVTKERYSKVLSTGYFRSLTGDWSDNAFDIMMNNRNFYIRMRFCVAEFIDILVERIHENWSRELAECRTDKYIADLLSDTFRGFMFTKDGAEVAVE